MFFSLSVKKARLTGSAGKPFDFFLRFWEASAVYPSTAWLQISKFFERKSHVIILLTHKFKRCCGAQRKCLIETEL